VDPRLRGDDSSAAVERVALTRTLALAQRRDKPGDAALQHVREALLTLADRA
jgi:hypothetical protein